MPLRGSKIKPDDLQTKLAELKEANKEVKFTKEELDYLAHAIHEIEDVADHPQAELIAVIAKLNERIAKLETKHRDAEERQAATAKDLKKTANHLVCGGIAGAVARSTVAPIDRAKILMQTQHVQLGERKYTGLFQTWGMIIKEEGPLKLWKGNVAQITRVIPYSATQFASYDFYKNWITPKDKKQTTVQRLTAGALAATTATTLTHPLDVIRTRLIADKDLKDFSGACKSIWNERGLISFFKGYTPTLLSLGPFIAINFATFDTLKTWAYPDKNQPTSTPVILGLGAGAGLFAQTCCYPLDTVRRRMQLKGKIYNSTFDAFKTIYTKEGFRGYYHGMIPNMVKIVPNNSIRFAVFEAIKDYFGVQRSSGEGGGGGG